MSFTPVHKMFIHFFVGEFDLPCVDVVDQFVAVHEVDADDIVVELVDDVHRMGEFLSFDQLTAPDLTATLKKQNL